MDIVARLRGDLIEHIQQVAMLRHLLPSRQHVGEAGEFFARRRGQRCGIIVENVIERIANGQAGARHPIEKGGQRLLADAARRHIDDALEADAIVGV